jgi:autotransporter strand-loop-strand O-heptosyltransferase
MNILFLTPHLSTGGMPEFLRQRIESLIDNNIFVIEYNNYSDIYSVQKDKIKNLIGENFISISDLKVSDKLIKLKDIIINNNIDIIHIDDNPETFDGTKIPVEIVNLIYANDRRWRVVETTHNIWFNDSNKKILPDGYAFCSEYHINNNFRNSKIPYDLIEYPIIHKQKSKKNPYDINKINILSVGLWSKGKNHGNTIEIARKYLEINPNVIFNIVGNYADNFKDYWGDIIPNIPENVIVWGERNDMDDFYSNCDIFLFNSIYELNPICIKEAISHNKKLMLRNLPVYMNKYENISFHILNDINDNVRRLEAAIESNYQHDIIYDTLSDFSIKHMNLYNTLLKNQPIINNINDYIIDINITYKNGIMCELLGNDTYKYFVSFFDNKTNELIYKTTIVANNWSKPYKQHYIEWRVEIESDNPFFNKYIDVMDLTDKKVSIVFDSSSLGDTIAWFPIIERFAIKNKCKVNLKTFKNFLFNDSDNVKLCDFNNNEECYSQYNIGVYNDHRNPNKWNTIPLGQVCSDILQIDYIEEKAILNEKHLNNERPISEKYIVIATNSTAQLKFWNCENGWEDVVKYLVSNGYRVFNTSKENNIFINGLESIDDYSIENTINWIQHSEFFIGLSSGISWLAWSLNKHCFLISGFIDDKCEFITNMTKIKNDNVCGGCWNTHKFDKSNWNWCPLHENTDRQFECSKKITSEMVINKIIGFLK